MNNDIHRFDKRLKAAEETLKTLPKRNQQIIRKFEDYCFSTGLSVPRIVKYLHTVKQVARMINKNLDQVNRENIEHLVAQIEKSSYKPWTKYDYKITIRKFFTWLGKEEAVSWLKPKVKPNQKILPEQLPTYEEILKMIKAVNHPRDKAFIITLWESGGRIGEIGNLNVEDVEFHENYTALRLKGKTGARRVIVVLSTPYLQTWIRHHPIGKGPLWVNLSCNYRHKKTTYSSLTKLLRKAARKAGIKKHIHPHLLRHAKLTELASELTEFQLSQYAGWVPDTKMASTYVHLAGRDLDEAILKHYGLAQNKKEENKIQPKTCPRCGVINAFESKFCSRCGLILDVKTAYQQETRKQKLKEKIKEALEILEIIEEDRELHEKLLARLKREHGET